MVQGTCCVYFHGANSSRREISPSSTTIHHAPASRNATRDLIHYYLDSIYKENFHLARPSCPPSPVSSDPDFPVTNHSYDSDSEMSSTVSSGKSKNVSYTAGAAYLHALMLRGIDVDQKELPHPNHLQPLLSQLEDTSGDSIIPPSILNTMWIRDNAPNESTFALTLPFLVMEWLQTIANVKVAINAQWSTVPLLSIDDRTLSLPKPDLTLGIRISAMEDGKKLAAIPQYALPLPCDSAFALPIVTMESKAGDIIESRVQNLHNAAVILRNISMLSSDIVEFQALRVFTVSIGKHEIEIRAHWATIGETTLEYHFSTICTSFLTRKAKDWMYARTSIERTVKWAYQQNIPWLNKAISLYKIA